jgi:cell division septation protein DedD
MLKTIGIFSLAGLLGVASYFCYREGSEWLAASKKGVAGEERSQGVTPAPRSGSVSGSSLVSSANAAVGGAPASSALPAASLASDAKPGQQIAETSQTPPAGSEFLFVQVAAYTTEADAFKLVNSLRQQQIAAFISPPVTDAFYRVQLGPYTTSEAARIGQRALEKAGYKPFIRR